eukprot:TRINITY_DN260_c0_g1_i1.p1 TRINITY_DN260_c0_g1~~TRINITY_DN260_c0_g1_i1.p1  ORF type:complete len:362 (-),score=67.14 TRINITY_DN260_c0_g1_i1:80-1165(-)
MLDSIFSGRSEMSSVSCIICPRNEGHKCSQKRTSVFGAVYKFDPKVQKVADLDVVDWNKVVGVHWAAGGPGNAGVSLVETENGMLVLKQGSNNATSQYFAQLLGRKLGLELPKTVVLSTKELNDIIAILNESNWSNTQDQLIRLHKLRLFSPCVMMEFLPGIALDKIPGDQLSEIFKKFPDIPRQIGGILAFDVIVNNWDRLPLIWSNEGNLGNLIINLETGIVHGIDQQLTGINNEEQTNRYLERVKAVMLETESKDSVGEHFLNIQKCFEDSASYLLTTEELLSMQSGVHERFTRIKEILVGGCLEELKSQVLSDYNDKERGHRCELQLIDLDFMTKRFLKFIVDNNTPLRIIVRKKKK